MMQIKKNIALSNTGFVFNPTTGDSYTINQVGQEILGVLKERGFANVRIFASERSADFHKYGPLPCDSRCIRIRGTNH